MNNYFIAETASIYQTLDEGKSDKGVAGERGRNGENSGTFFHFHLPLLLVNGQLDDTFSPKWYRLSYERKIKDMDRDD